MAKPERPLRSPRSRSSSSPPTATVVTEYRGLSVANLAELRRSWRHRDPHRRQEHAGQGAAAEAGKASTICSPDRPRSRSSPARRLTP